MYKYRLKVKSPLPVKSKWKQIGCIGTLVIGLLLSVSALPAYAEKFSTVSENELNVVAGDNIRLSNFHQGIRFFGSVKLLDTAETEQIFHLKNVGDTPLTDLRLQASCGCLS